MRSNHILIVEDEAEIGELVQDYLTAEGYKVQLTTNGEEGLKQFKQEEPVLVVLDIMLPNIDGIEVCRQIREVSSVPILMMSAKQAETDKIISLGIGADDYITKPFSPGELVARIKAHLRRYQHFSRPLEEANVRVYGDIELRPETFEVYIKGRKVAFTAKEFQLLDHLMSHPGRVYTKEQLYDRIWGQNHLGDVSTVTVYIRKIREKIEEDPSRPNYIQTVWGVGYRFNNDL
ncbi:DNA-binding response OmpR family regulator [Salsuginibacillus halophilus]|uniref:DNA-binding response OmpR family regulator n=1 Tax=Salsuginibacillus halophilus TaxID=517424 RepID=A0A2P8HEB3_9BACI|nr:response regulator transcription factor [Salsuginibacillus halophilus]PSL44562.1 DNA-binding response OmpR family regulator [Salsuginibacillus halophilus]